MKTREYSVHHDLKLREVFIMPEDIGDGWVSSGMRPDYRCILEEKEK